MRIDHLMRFSPIMLVGIVLIVLGTGALAYQGISYTTRDNGVTLRPNLP